MTTLYYDGLGRVTRARNALNKDTYLYYAGGCSGCSGGGQVTKVKDVLNNETEFRYNANGNVTKVIDQGNRIKN